MKRTAREYKMDSVYRKIPDLVLQGLVNYRDKGIIPGSFLQAVLSNDLAMTVGKADPFSYSSLKEIVTFVYNEMPSPCWGSREKIIQWSERFKELEATDG